MEPNGRKIKTDFLRRRPALSGCAIFIVVSALFMIGFGLMAERGRAGRAFGDNLIGIVPVEGIIEDSRLIVEQLDDFRTDDSIAAVVVRIDSPGGAVGPSQEIYDAVKRLDKVKPVVASMGTVAASGGYYIAAGARKIISNPGALTGSIGVIMEFTNLEGILEWTHIRREVIKSGELKDIGSPFRPMTERERALLQGLIDDVYNQFVDAVADGRKMKREEVAALANGMIYSGRQAMDNKLIDGLGGLHEAVRMAAELAHVGGEPETVYPPEDTPGLLDFFKGAKGLVNGVKLPGVRIMYLMRIR